MSISNVENVAPNVLRRISKELAEIVSDPPEGIKIIPNEEDVSDIQAIIDGPAGTPYQNGCFRVKLALGKTFPAAPPKGYFLTKIFHPNVSSCGEICVNTLKKDWNESLGIKHILLVIKCLLIVPNAESALNEDAAKLMLEDYDEYFHRAKMITEVHAKKCDSKIKIDDYSNDDSSNNPSSTRKPLTNDLMPLSKRPANSSNSSHPSAIKQIKKPTSNKNSNNKKRALKRL